MKTLKIPQMFSSTNKRQHSQAKKAPERGA